MIVVPNYNMHIVTKTLRQTEEEEEEEKEEEKEEEIRCLESVVQRFTIRTNQIGPSR